MRALNWLKKKLDADQLRFRSLGIAARLGLACAAVLILVLATTYFARESSRRAALQAAAVKTLHEPLADVAQRMLHEAAALNQVVLELAHPEAAPTREPLDLRLAELTELAAAYRALQPDAAELLDVYHDHVSAHELRARELLVLAQRRRALITDYWQMFDTLDRGITAAEATLAARPDVNLTQALGRIQDRFASYANAGGRETERAIASSESELRRALRARHDELTAAVGAAEVARLGQQFEAVIRARRSLVALNTLMTQSHAAFAATRLALTTFLETQIAAPSRTALAGAAVQANEIATRLDRTLTQLGIVTFSILLLICAATAYGVIIPVRSLIQAIGEIARGMRGHRVRPLAAVQELETLAAAFNDMSQQLERAEQQVHSYQAQLEARVDERTRQLDFLAHHDSLTHLPNRHQLGLYLERTLATARIHGTYVGVLFLDVDNFKTVNDTLGHEAGDQLLKGIAQRLRTSNAAAPFAARLGGDEFTVVYEQVRDVEELSSYAAALLARFQQPLEVDGKRLAVGLSIGTSLFPEHAQDAAALLRAADAALFRSKESGRNRYTLYGPELLRAASTRFQIEQDLRRAVQRGDFELHMQPVMSLGSYEVTGVEALVRWRRNGELVLPGEFLGVAEASGLIKDINDWVLETAIREAAVWHREGGAPLKVALNVSAQQLLDAQFHIRLGETLARYSVPGSLIEIELTENALQTDQATVEALHSLRAQGLAIALDDFGTGFSSLTSLEQLPLTRVKLDRSLIRDIDSNPRSASIARSIIELCHSLGLSVTAEGVERHTQLAFLRQYQPVSIQGYLLSPAVPPAQLRSCASECRERLQRELSRCTPPPPNDSTLVPQLRLITK